VKPLCDLCRTRHELYQGHVFAANPVANGIPVANRVANRQVDVGPVLNLGTSAQVQRNRNEATTAPAEQSGPNKYRDLEKRKAYMKEYMRKRRLKV
jgi:hypothetical protein